MNTCLNCGEPCPKAHNYCEVKGGKNCYIEHTKANGGQEYLPNGLPIRCIRFDGLMLEHEHGDHADYMFPVHVEYVGPEPEKVFGLIGPDGPIEVSPEWVRSQSHETHALIYTDGNIAVTMSECCYAFWSMNSGLCIGGHLWDKDEWKMTDDSIQKAKVSCAHKEDR